MKVKDVPQDENHSYEGKYKIRYAKNDDGQIIAVKSSGWDVEESVTSLTWEDINSNLKAIYEQVEKGSLSPLAFHMEKALLTPKLLAQNLGMWTFVVKSHLKPKKFQQLKDQQLKKYCDYFDLTVEEFTSLPMETPWK